MQRLITLLHFYVISGKFYIFKLFADQIICSLDGFWFMISIRLMRPPLRCLISSVSQRAKLIVYMKRHPCLIQSFCVRKEVYFKLQHF